MKKKVLAVAFVLAPLLSVMAGLSFVSLVEANPFWWFENVPPDEYTKPPVISVFSPANNTMFNEDNVYLSFSVDVGESKTAWSVGLINVRYETDWEHNNTDYFRPWKNLPFSHEVNLTGIPEGNHTITFQATERGAYENAQAFKLDSSSTVFFTIDTTSGDTAVIPEFPSWIILPLLLTATLVAIICKKRLPKTPNQQSY